MRNFWRVLPLAVVAAGMSVIVGAPSADADCTGAGAATVCAQGTVRGGGPEAPQAGPVYPGYCADPWYCSDDWGIDVIIDPNPPRPPIDIGRPGRPGQR
ncbi:hypothetical protein MPUL_03460 [Mycolicibacterium pulveris]|uniref:Secreted protein n=2 Tax=Mycolicibacterium pulveris TaxID=36813 RepID=A0A7I7UCK3_MYCPV|nr:hypothetical protein MPUL_03460 [Mycolicibacterium pulveris]